MNTKGTLREIFSGANGKLSAKRIVGGIAMTVALASTIYLVIVDGSNDVVENLLTTIFLLSAYLLGLPAITGIFGKSRITSVGVGYDPVGNNEYNYGYNNDYRYNNDYSHRYGGGYNPGYNPGYNQEYNSRYSQECNQDEFDYGRETMDSYECYSQKNKGNLKFPFLLNNFHLFHFFS